MKKRRIAAGILLIVFVIFYGNLFAITVNSNTNLSIRELQKIKFILQDYNYVTNENRQLYKKIADYSNLINYKDTLIDVQNKIIVKKKSFLETIYEKIDFWVGLFIGLYILDKIK